MRRGVVVCAIVVGGAVAHVPAVRAQALKTAVVLAGANATTDTMEVQVPAGNLSLDLFFFGTGTLPQPSSGTLAVTPLRATSAPGDQRSTEARAAGSAATGRDGTPFEVMLATGVPVKIAVTANDLRPTTTYTSTVILSALKETRQWELTLTTGAKGTLVADPIPAYQFERSVGLWLCEWFERLGCTPGTTGDFTFSLRNKTPIGPLTNLHVRFDPGPPTSSKTPRSNFAIDNFRFSTTTDPFDGKAAAKATASKEKGAGGLLDGRLLDTPHWYVASVSGLEPGEYSGALRFSASEALDDATDSRLALAINVRDPRPIAIAVLVLGSIIGWFTTKYLVAARKARDMARSVRTLRDRADDLTRGHRARQGWQFSSEATSYTLIKVRVMLNRLAALTASGLPMLVQETQLTALKDDAETRLTKLEALREMRLQVQVVADNKPTVQRVVGRLLRDACNLLEQAVFGTAQQAAFAARLAELQPWIGADTRLQKYREALAARSTVDNTGFTPADVSQPLRVHVAALLGAWPTVATLTAADVTVATLQPFDEKFETLALLRREERSPWAQDLANAFAQGASLKQLFDVVDKGFWNELERVASTITIVPDAAGRTTIEAYNPVEVHLDVPGVERSRVLKHPLRVIWTITSPGGGTRVVETDDITLVQYFSSPGKATIAARLQWSTEKPIDVPVPIELTITANDDYRWYHLFKQGGAAELVAVGIAIVFAVVTAMQTQYDSTFGSVNQYLGLFIWAAGAATGGNVLKQLGTTSTPGGQADATLPARP